MNQAALRKSLHVIAYNKREAFVQGSEATQSIFLCVVRWIASLRSQ
jgi:hypothetical protein